jgi:hypothetical protein
VNVARRLAVLAIGALLATVACGAPPSKTSPPPASIDATGEPPLPQPPIAVLTFAGGEPVAGDLGTYTYRGTGSEAPWLAGEPVAVPPTGALAQVFLSEPLPIASWWARVAPTGRQPRLGEPREIGTGAGPIAFELPTGAWTLELSVQFGDGIGDATYFWELGQD